jgi:hypothetical protein
MYCRPAASTTEVAATVTNAISNVTTALVWSLASGPGREARPMIEHTTNAKAAMTANPSRTGGRLGWSLGTRNTLAALVPATSAAHATIKAASAGWPPCDDHRLVWSISEPYQGAAVSAPTARAPMSATPRAMRNRARASVPPSLIGREATTEAAHFEIHSRPLGDTVTVSVTCWCSPSRDLPMQVKSWPLLGRQLTSSNVGLLPSPPSSTLLASARGSFKPTGFGVEGLLLPQPTANNAADTPTRTIRLTLRYPLS